MIRIVRGDKHHEAEMPQDLFPDNNCVGAVVALPHGLQAELGVEFRMDDTITLTSAFGRRIEGVILKPNDLVKVIFDSSTVEA